MRASQRMGIQEAIAMDDHDSVYLRFEVCLKSDGNLTMQMTAWLPEQQCTLQLRVACQFILSSNAIADAVLGLLQSMCLS